MLHSAITLTARSKENVCEILLFSALVVIYNHNLIPGMGEITTALYEHSMYNVRERQKMALSSG